MTTIILALLGKFWPVILAGLGALAWGFRQRRAGANAERAKQAKAEAKARDIADEIDDAVAGRSADENRKELAKWSRR
jgi:hypothetical protein